MDQPQDLIRYRIDPVSPIQHGQGQVWRAHDLLFDRPVALKLIATDLAMDESARLTFQKEAMVGARLGEWHPNIVRVHDLDSTGRLLYFAMEWMDGGTLLDLCGKVSFRRALQIMNQLASALAAAHHHGVIHSDVAPMNVLHDGRDLFKLADFGYLKIVDSVLISRGDQPLLIGGRRSYMPPAHHLNPANINSSTDTYALALTFYILVTGKAPDIDDNGLPRVPQSIVVRHDRTEAPDDLRKLINRFTHGRQNDDNGNHFLEYVRRRF